METLLREELLDWLLAGEPWVVYRTLADLLDRTEKDDAVTAAKMAMPEHPLIERIFKGLNRDGYWGKPKDIRTWWPRKDTAFWILPVLADFGLTVADKSIARACEYVFSTQLSSRAFGWDPPTKPGDCHTAIISESLAKLGRLRDSGLAWGITINERLALRSQGKSVRHLDKWFLKAIEGPEKARNLIDIFRNRVQTTRGNLLMRI